MSDRMQGDMFATRGVAGAEVLRRRGGVRSAYMPPRLDGRVRDALEVGRVRMLVVGAALLLAFATVGGRATQLALLGVAGGDIVVAQAQRGAGGPQPRGNILDRNGEILATDLPTASLYANARRLLDPEEAARALVNTLPDLDFDTTLKRLRSGKTFVWLRRNLTPREQWAVNRLGIPGLDFVREFSRVYPHGPLLSHVTGYVDSDNIGIAGLEKSFDDSLAAGEDLRLTVDLRIQHAMREELRDAMIEYRARGAAGLVLDARNGAVVAMVSLPDFDANHPGKAREEALFNRASLGVYELGSTFKVFTTAIALDAGVASMTQQYDATEPLRVARFTIRDYHARKRWLSLPEVFMYSSNIGAARMAMDIGGETQQDYLRRLGLLDPAPLEIPEVGAPLVPSPWRPVNTMTIGFGHGLAVSPLQLASGVATVVNGGVRHDPTLVQRPYRTPVAEPARVFRDSTSLRIRQLMRLAVVEGTGRNAEVAGYPVGGKTGTAEKPGSDGYQGKALLSSFVGAFPIDDPKYVVLVVLDEPQGNKKTQGYATGGWVAAPVVGAVIARMAPMLGMPPAGGSPPPSMRPELDELTEGRKLASY